MLLLPPLPGPYAAGTLWRLGVKPGGGETRNHWETGTDLKLDKTELCHEFSHLMSRGLVSQG